MKKLKLYTSQEIVNMLFDTTEEMGKIIFDHKEHLDFKTFNQIVMTVIRFKTAMLEKLGFPEEDMTELVNEYEKYKEANERKEQID